MFLYFTKFLLKKFFFMYRLMENSLKWHWIVKKNAKQLFVILISMVLKKILHFRKHQHPGPNYNIYTLINNYYHLAQAS